MQEPNYERKFEQPTWKARTVSYDNWVILTKFTTADLELLDKFASV